MEVSCADFFSLFPSNSLAIMIATTIFLIFSPFYAFNKVFQFIRKRFENTDIYIFDHVNRDIIGVNVNP